jgi:hypothetical protein
LKKEANSQAKQYSLREGLRLLGSAGFFFEKYIDRLFTSEIYDTRANLILQGKCVSHEIDVLVKKDVVVSMIECKFHSRREATSDMKVPLYVCQGLMIGKELIIPFFRKQKLFQTVGYQLIIDLPQT